MTAYNQVVLTPDPNYLQAKSYSAQSDRKWFRDIASPGVQQDTDFALTLLGGMSLRLSGGVAWILGQNVADQGIYRQYVAGNSDITANASDPANPRIDQIILRMMDNAHDGSGFNEGRVEYIPGLASAGATLANRTGAKDLQALAEASKNVLLLYDILVPAAASSITGGNTARRVFKSVVGRGSFEGNPPVLTVAQFQALKDFPDGYEVYVIADATNRILWRFRYNAAGGTYKWEGVGGQIPLTAYNGSNLVAAGSTWNDMLGLAVPLAGDYILQGAARGIIDYLNGAFAYVGIAVGSGGSVLQTVSNGVTGNWASGNPHIETTSTIPPFRHAGMTAGASYYLRAYHTIGNMMYDRHISATPIRVSQ